MAGVAVGSVVTTVGAAINGRIARRATAMTIEAEHRQRLWEKQSTAYEETVREVLARQTRREMLTSRGDPGNIGTHPIEEMRKNEEPESVRIRALMLAYASVAVWSAYQQADKANNLFWVNLAHLANAQAISQMPTPQEPAPTEVALRPPVADYQRALAAMNKSKEDAVVADKALFAAINRELSWTPCAGSDSHGSGALRRYQLPPVPGEPRNRCLRSSPARVTN